MPRGVYPRSAAEVAAAAKALDDELPPGPVQRTVPAAGAKPPATTAARSAFDLVPRRDAPPAEIVIRKGVPMPPRKRGNAGQYGPVIERMEVGDSVELPAKQARGFHAAAKVFGKTCTPPPVVPVPHAERHARRRVA